MRLFPRLAAIAALGLASLAVPLSASAAAQTWTVSTGGTADDSVEALVFGPGKLTVNQGDTITWHIGSKEPHVIAFGFSQPVSPIDPKATAPIPGTSFDGTTQVSSGLAFKDFSLTMNAAPGTYNYFCFIHPGMAGQVVVQAPGSPYPQQQAEATATGQQQIKAAIAATQALVPGAKGGSSAGANGATTWTVPSVGSGNAFAARFLDGNLTIKAGDTVTWVNSDPIVPHTVTFGTPPPGPPDAVGAKPAGGPTYSGSGFSNSGFYGMLPGLHKTYSLTFTSPGSYNYICLLHVEEGMVGNITVTGGAPVQAPAQAPVTPAALPNTGGGGPGLPGWAFGLGALLLAGGSTLLVRSQRQS